MTCDEFMIGNILLHPWKKKWAYGWLFVKTVRKIKHTDETQIKFSEKTTSKSIDTLICRNYHSFDNVIPLRRLYGTCEPPICIMIIFTNSSFWDPKFSTISIAELIIRYCQDKGTWLMQLHFKHKWFYAKHKILYFLLFCLKLISNLTTKLFDLVYWKSLCLR